MEGVFHFKIWLLNAPELIHGRAYYRNFTVYVVLLSFSLVERRGRMNVLHM